MCFLITNLKTQNFVKITNSPVVTDNSYNYYTCWGDYDNDGDLDLYLPTWFASAANPKSLNFLFQNNCNGEFTKINAIPGGLTTDTDPGEGAYWIDYNNDGNLDLYVWGSV